ncbi:hypothetical protein F53441_5499 [Fusarium austroafricanum]|uniref:Uncharacterized protein n=1 Tax=Fusarium austroafricanum TaxID=2364996 RepID=A0A8H4KJL6_9HYPO|nr:hypothetical protein F53441_5499 [Fusarium austroafricanum]
MSESTVCITLYIFRGNPDFYFARHVLAYFTCPDNPNFHETVHAQHETESDPWKVDRIHRGIDWALSATYMDHVNAGALRVRRGREMDPVDVVAAIPVEGRERITDWNCQNFVLEGLQALVSCGYQTQQWYDIVEGELMDKLLDGTVG